VLSVGLRDDVLVLVQGAGCRVLYLDGSLGRESGEGGPLVHDQEVVQPELHAILCRCHRHLQGGFRV